MKSIEKIQTWLQWAQISFTLHEDLSMLYCCWRH